MALASCPAFQGQQRRVRRPGTADQALVTREFETDHGDNAVRQLRKPRSRKIDALAGMLGALALGSIHRHHCGHDL